MQDNHLKIILVFGVWLIYFSFGFCIASLSPLVHFITDDLSISFKKMGLILGSWQFIYILFAIPAGYLLDKFSFRNCLFVATIVIACSLLFRSLSTNFTQLLFSVCLFGLGGSLISVGIPKVTSIHFTGKARSIVMGVLMTGPSLGAISCLVITSLVFLPIYGADWRNILFIYSFVPILIGLLWILLNYLFLPNDEFKKEIFSISHQLDTIYLFLKNKRIVLILILAISAFYLNHGIGNWLPKILVSKGISVSSASIYAAIPVLTGIFSALTIPRFAMGNKRFYILLFLFLNVNFSLFFLQSENLYYLIIGLIFLGLTTGSLIAILLTHLTDTNIINKKNSGISGGLFFTMAEIGGILGPFSIGFIYDYTNDFNHALIFYSIVFFVILLPLFLLKNNNYKY